MRRIFILVASGALLAASSPGWAETPLPPGKPAGVRQAFHERNVGVIFLGALSALGIGIVLVTTGKDHPAPTSTATH